MSSVLAELLPFDCLKVNDFPSSAITNEKIFRKLILNMYDYSVVMHVKFHQGVISYRGVNLY